MLDFLNEFSIKGRWWIPALGKTEKEGLYGDMTYSPDKGIQLSIEGSFYGTTSILRAVNYLKVDYLCGVLNDGQNVALYYLEVNEFGQDSWITTNVSAEFALLNSKGYFATQDMPVFGINFNTNFFAAFFQFFRPVPHLEHTETGGRISYTEAPPIDVIDSEVHVYFKFSYQVKGLSSIFDTISIQEKVYLNIFFDEPFGTGDIIRKLNFYRDFFTFFSFQKISFNAASVFTKDEKNDQVDFDLLFSDPAQSSKRQMEGYDVLIKYTEIAPVFQNCFQKWINNETVLQSGLLLYLQTKQLKLPTPIQQFLNTVFALETLHNTYFDHSQFAVEKYTEFKKQKKEAIQKLDEEFRPKALECMAHFNTLSFKARLKEMIESNIDLCNEFIYDIDDFCKRVTQHRNFLAHDHSQNNRSVINIEQYGYFNAMLKMVFECNFLSLLGVEKPLLTLMLKKNYLLQHYKGEVHRLRNELLKPSAEN